MLCFLSWGVISVLRKNSIFQSFAIKNLEKNWFTDHKSISSQWNDIDHWLFCHHETQCCKMSWKITCSVNNNNDWNVFKKRYIKLKWLHNKLKSHRNQGIFSMLVLNKKLKRLCLTFKTCICHFLQALLKTKGVGKRCQVGFPPLFLCMVALICLTIGYLVRA